MDFTPHTDDDVTAMLATLGVETIDELFEQIPEPLRLRSALDLPAGVSEQEIVDDVAALASKNRSLEELVCFAGRGAYDHYIPSVVWDLAGRSEFYTSYTPYQPELSQGVLQALFEFQSMVCELTGLDVSNASLYDGGTALVEAAHMCHAGERARFLAAQGVDPRLVDTLRTYGAGAGYSVEVVDEVPPTVDADVAGVIVQHPTVFGVLEDVRGWAAAAHAGGARLIQVFDPMSLGVLAPPGELGTDIAVAEGQPLGNHLAFGGPYLGIIAARMTDVRRMPGRIVGETLDAAGRTGYVLTLQAREQHIRREKATSNICTNQTLMALAATVYLAWLGPEGYRALGEACAAKAAYALEALIELPGVEAAFPGAAVFKEFTVRLSQDATEIRDRMLERGFLAGVPAPWIGADALIVAVTERRTTAEIDAFVAAMGEEIA